MAISNSTMNFFRFLHTCQRNGVRLRSTKIENTQGWDMIVFHFAKQRFLGNNTFFFDDDYYLHLDVASFKSDDELYNVVIENITKRYKFKYERKENE